MTRLLIVIGLMGLLAACDVPQTQTPQSAPVATTAAPEPRDELRTRDQAVRAFGQMVRRFEPIAERECKSRTQGVDCDFLVLVDDRPNVPVNAFQTLNDEGRPVIIFTLPLIEDARNVDELAFVFGHEVAHHIHGHIARQQRNTAAGAAIFAGLARAVGGGAGSIDAASRLGATVGARSYSKEFELEADALGTVLAHRAGFSPLRGAEFFNRIPDPGDRFLGTHPPNDERIAVVRRVASQL